MISLSLSPFLFNFNIHFNLSGPIERSKNTRGEKIQKQRKSKEAEGRKATKDGQENSIYFHCKASDSICPARVFIFPFSSRPLHPPRVPSKLVICAVESASIVLFRVGNNLELKTILPFGECLCFT